MGHVLIVVLQESEETFLATDCVNGTLMPRSLMPKKVNFTLLLQLFGSEDGYTKYKMDAGNNTDIPFDIDITIYNETKLKMNHEGCSNYLSEECTFFHKYFGQVGGRCNEKFRLY